MIDERKLILSKTDDMISAVKRGRTMMFTSFLSMDESLIVTRYIQNRVSHYVFGGYSDSERNVIGISDGEILENYMFPICTLRFSCKSDKEIAHRDVLGSLMSLGLKREMFGDIVFIDDWCYIFCINSISDYLVQNFTSVKKSNISLEYYFDEIDFKRLYEENTIIIMSMRLDCIVSEVSSVSRTVASEMILGGYVNLNGEQCFKKDKTIKEGDIISVRKKGKFRIGDMCGTTKKDRIKLKIFKYI